MKDLRVSRDKDHFSALWSVRRRSTRAMDKCEFCVAEHRQHSRSANYHYSVLGRDLVHVCQAHKAEAERVYLGALS